MEVGTIVTEQSLPLREEWYEALVNDLKATKVETEFIAREEFLKGKWLIGKRIATDENVKKYSKESAKLIKQLAQDIGCSEVNLYFCRQFYEQFPVDTEDNLIASLPEGKNISWHRITQLYLGNRQAPKETMRKISIEAAAKRTRQWLIDMYGQYPTDADIQRLVDYLNQ